MLWCVLFMLTPGKMGITMATPQGARDWIELGTAAAAIVISAISLSVAAGTEDSNNKMVAAASWPFLQLDSSNTDETEQPKISLSLTNSGVGPAKVETFEVIWNGKAYPGAGRYMRACCGFTGINNANSTPMITGTSAGAVIRAGETRPFFSMRRGPDNAKLWDALNRERFRTTFRACYCSVFDECWISTLNELHPKPVHSCPVPKVSYVQ